MARDHGNCPACQADLNGGSIYQHFLAANEPAEALRIAKMYGATETEGQWGRATAIYSQQRDRTVAYRCPDCGHEWPALEQANGG